LKKKLKDKLDDLIIAVPEDNRSPLQKAIQGPLWKEDPIGNECLCLISKITDYEIFDNHGQYLSNGSFNTTLEQLLDWLLKRARKVGSQESINELDLYISSSEITVEQIELVVETLAACQYQFSNGVQFLNPQNISNTSLASDLINDVIESRTPFPRVRGVFVAEFQQPVVHIKNNDTYKPNTDIEIPYDKIKSTKLILSLVRSVKWGIHTIASTTITQDSIPYVNDGQTWNIHPFKSPSYGGQIIELEFRQANALLKKYELLGSSFKDKLRIPLEKLNGFGSSEPLVDRAIELRICLESIFLNEGNKEQLGYRLALRASLFLGTSLDDRKKIFKLII